MADDFDNVKKKRGSGPGGVDEMTSKVIVVTVAVGSHRWNEQKKYRETKQRYTGAFVIIRDNPTGDVKTKYVRFFSKG